MRFYNLTQDRYMTCQAYLEKFQNSVEVIEHCDGDLSIDTGLIDATFTTTKPAVTRDTATPPTLKAAEKYASQRAVLGLYFPPQI
jgi:hypothetical protein